MRHGYQRTNQMSDPLMMSGVSRPAIKTQTNCHGDGECAAMVVVVVVVGEGLLEGKCVYVRVHACSYVLFNGVWDARLSQLLPRSHCSFRRRKEALCSKV